MYFSNEINNHLENKKPHDTKANTCHNWSWYDNLIWYRSSYRDIGFTHIVAHPKVFALTIAMVITMAVAHYTINCLGYSDGNLKLLRNRDKMKDDAIAQLSTSTRLQELGRK